MLHTTVRTVHTFFFFFFGPAMQSPEVLLWEAQTRYNGHSCRIRDSLTSMALFGISHLLYCRDRGGDWRSIICLCGLVDSVLCMYVPRPSD